MRKGTLIIVGGLILALGVVAFIAEARSITGEKALFRPVKNLAADAHVQGMESMAVGRAFAPEGAPSHGTVIGKTIPGKDTPKQSYLQGKGSRGIEWATLDPGSRRPY